MVLWQRAHHQIRTRGIVETDTEHALRAGNVGQIQSGIR
uniref:Uncharacterized protein n=1 Tax=uncultured bacterium 126 TaxID=698379 RepID=E3T712_9BACT|nr:hypothetical protein [uncultured bacterium 126]